MTTTSEQYDISQAGWAMCMVCDISVSSVTSCNANYGLFLDVDVVLICWFCQVFLLHLVSRHQSFVTIFFFFTMKLFLKFPKASKLTKSKTSDNPHSYSNNILIANKNNLFFILWNSFQRIILMMHSAFNTTKYLQATSTHSKWSR